MKTAKLDKYNAATKAILTQMKAYITKNYGKRCKDTEPHCACCEAWRLFDQFQGLVR